MVRALWTVFALLVAAVWADAAEVTVTSEPPGAEVYASPADEPVIYRKGLTPCTIGLDDARGPHTLLLRMAGSFDAYRVVAAAGAVEVTLLSRDDPSNWERLPLPPVLSRGGKEKLAAATEAVPSPEDLAAGRSPGGFAVLPPRPPLQSRCRPPVWAPDGSSAAYSCNPFGEDLTTRLPGGVVSSVTPSELWWVPLAGDEVLVWRHASAEGPPFEINVAFGPSPRWLVHSAPVGDRERLELRCLATGQSRTIATDKTSTLYSPVFSCDGRLIACLCSALSREDEYGELEAAIQVMSWTGEGRRTVARDPYPHLAPVFSPDGSRLAYVDLKGRVAVVDLQTKRSVVVLSSDDWYPWGSPVWSPDERTIAADFLRGSLESGGTAQPSRVMWARVDGSGSGHIPGVDLFGWHDGQSIDVYAAGYDTQEQTSFQRIVQVGLDGKATKTLRGRWQIAPGWFLHIAPNVPAGA